MGKRKLIENEQYRIVSFSKRRRGLFNKAMELSALTGAQTVALVVSEAGVPYAVADPSVDSVINCFFGISGETQQNDHGSSSSSSSFSALLNAEVEECDRIDELWALREKLEEMRKNVSLALDLRFADSFLA